MTRSGLKATMPLAVAAIILAASFEIGPRASEGSLLAADEELAQVEADRVVVAERCDVFKENARQICLALADGEALVARAQLELRREPGPERERALALAEGRAELGLSLRRCADWASARKEACSAQARAQFALAEGLADFQLELARARAGEGGEGAAARASERMRERSLQARFEEAKSRCVSLVAKAYEACVAQAKGRVGLAS